MHGSLFSKAIRVFLLTFVLSYCMLFAVFANKTRPSVMVSFSFEIATSDDLLKILYKRTELSSIEELAEAEYLTAAEATLLANKNSLLNYATVWRILLPAFGIYPYPAECYNIPQYPYTTALTENYANARVAAILCGLTTETQCPDAPMKLDDLRKLVSELESREIVLPAPGCNSKYILEIEKAAKAAGEPAWNVNTYRGRNSFISSYKLLPAEWLADFEACGWKIEFQLPDDYGSVNPTPDGVVMGVTYYEFQTIYICNTPARITLHEFTHFAASRVGWTVEFLDDVFRDEASTMQLTLGDYSQQNSSEYLADFVAYWLLYPEAHSTLRIIAPQSAVLAEELTEGYLELRAAR